MDSTVLIELVGSLGFPIAMCIAFFWQINKKDSTYLEQLQTQDQLHDEQIEKISTALNNNTLVLTQLLERLGGGISG